MMTESRKIMLTCIYIEARKQDRMRTIDVRETLKGMSVFDYQYLAGEYIDITLTTEQDFKYCNLTYEGAKYVEDNNLIKKFKELIDSYGSKEDM